MKRMRLPLILLLVLKVSAGYCQDLRIVSLKPNITEILFALGVGDKVVGVTKYCDYPKEAKRLPRIADYTRPFIEPIVALEPDIVIGSKEESSKKSVLELKKMGINIVWLPFSTIEEIKSSIIEIARLVGRQKEGEKIVQEMDARLKKISKERPSTYRKKILIIVGHNPTIVAGPKTYLGEVLYLAGAQNASYGRIPYPKWSAENIIASNPDVIIDMSMEDRKKQDEILRDISSLSTVTAVRNKEIYFLDIKNFRPSNRIADGVEKLNELSYKK